MRILRLLLAKVMTSGPLSVLFLSGTLFSWGFPYCLLGRQRMKEIDGDRQGAYRVGSSTTHDKRTLFVSFAAVFFLDAIRLV